VGRARRSVAVLAVLAGLAAATGLAGCATANGAASRPVTTSGDAARCPGRQVHVVVSVSQWSDLARTLGGDCATVTTVLASAAVDPHDYEPRPADIAAFERADVVVLNGAGYDTWAADAVRNLDPRPAVVTAADLAGWSEGDNPHLWYDPDALAEMARTITGELTKQDRKAADVFTAQATAWQRQLQPYTDELAALRTAAAGRTYAATETVFDLTARAVGLRDVTPEGYRSAVSNEGDPAPGDIAAFESALRDGTIDVLVLNTQTEGELPDQLRTTAEHAGVPVVEVTESPPDPGGSFVAWQLAQLRRLSTALAAS
jgi:zinc/manganese transport system substrate-binding protein